MTVVEAGPGTIVETLARSLAQEGFAPSGRQEFGSDPAWAALRSLGTELWLDTGDLDAARKLWTREFSNLTTNNTLVNREVQKGLFDELIGRAGRALRDADSAVSPGALVVEAGFVVNCRAALRLVEAFDATVSVELHPGMADDVERSVAFGRRYHAVCPERFIVKVPLTPAGFLAARRLSADGIPVNYTLGFSARQNVLAAAFSRPAYVNVFMGRLNSFVADNGLGDGAYVGEKATMATQMALLEGRERRGWRSRLIGASMRSGAQIEDLAGLDVFTMPTAAAEEYRGRFHAARRTVVSQVGRDFTVEAEPPSLLDCLWTVDERIHQIGEVLAATDLTGWTGADVRRFVADYSLPGLFHDWTEREQTAIRSDGKIPRWSEWQEELRSGAVALDDLMTQSALQSFVSDQAALDERIRTVLSRQGVLA